MVWLRPTGNWKGVVVNEAVSTPFTRLSATLLASTVLPSMKVTVPVGLIAPAFGVTAAENVTGWPKTALLGAVDHVELTPTVTRPRLTVWAVVPELAVKSASPA